MEEQTIDPSTKLFGTAAPRVVRLEPPLITSRAILNKVTCVRPMRDGRFNISIEEVSTNRVSKILVHCYGHGGSGFTTLFGSVERAIRLFQLESRGRPARPVRVIGSGCMGLTVAIELTRLGYTVAGVTTKELYDIPSWRAAGYFAFVSVKTAPEEQANLDQIGIETFKAYRAIDAGLHPYISRDAVRYMPIYGSKNTEVGLEALEAHGLIPPHEDVTLDFGAIQHEGYVKYMTYFMHTTKIMRQLTDEVNRLGIPVEIREVSSWDEVEEEVVFNCSGLGSREINHDCSMIPVRGHLLLLNEASGTAHMDYIIYTTALQNGREEYVYLFPKCEAVSSVEPVGIACQGIIGGTFIPHTDKLSVEDLERLDQEEFNKMVERATLFFHGSYTPHG